MSGSSPSSQTACGYWIGVQASSAMPAILVSTPALIAGFARVVIEYHALTRTAAATTSWR